MRLIYYLQAIRPANFIKNLIIFGGIIFSKNLLNFNYLSKITESFVAFCFITGGIYVLNDIIDLPYDKSHPKKRLRPIAAGKITPFEGLVLGIILILIGVIWGLKIGLSLFIIALIYILLMLSYNLKLKQIVILDSLIIATGFVLRGVAGTIIINVEFSPWFFLCAFILALFIVFCKRRGELVKIEEKKLLRKVLEKYSVEMLDQLVAISASSLILTYSLYTISPITMEKFGTQNLIYTIPFVIFGVFRYIYLVFSRQKGEFPEKLLLKDLPIILDILLWVVSVLAIVYWASISRIFCL